EELLRVWRSHRTLAHMGHAPVAQLCPNCHAGPSRQLSAESPALRPTPSAGLSLPPNVLNADCPTSTSSPSGRIRKEVKELTGTLKDNLGRVVQHGKRAKEHAAGFSRGLGRTAASR